MTELFDLEAWRQIFVSALSELGANVAGFLPNLIGAVLILLIGWGLSRGLEAIASRVLRGVGIDGAALRLGLADLLARAEIRLTLSQIVARLVFWLLMLTFVLSSVETLGLSAVTETIDRLIAFIPNLIGAALIAVGGLLLARIIDTLVSSAAAAAGFASSSGLGFLAQIVVGSMVLMVAIEQLGVSTHVLILPVSVLLGTAGFALALAFALGARPVITHIMAGHFLKRSLPRDVPIEIGGQRGLVERVGAVETLVRGEDRAWSVPNGHLMEQIVER